MEHGKGKENDNWLHRFVWGSMWNMVWLTVGLLVVLFISALAGCSTKRAAVGTSSVSVDTVYKVRLVQDSVRVRDSVWVETYLRGDTVYRVKEVTRWRDRMSVRTDTVYRAALRTDTIKVPVAVERRLSWRERARDKVENVACLVALLCLLPVAARWAWRRVRSATKEKE